jgi:tape measure domain-containing protein
LNSLKNSSIGKTFDGISNSLNSVGNMATSVGKKITVGLTAPLTALATAGIKYNAEMQTYNTRLKTLLGSAAEAQKTLDQIKKDAAATPFDVAGLTQANSLLISAGLSADDSRKTILALGDAVSASGGGNEELQRMAVNLQQVKNVGKATALDIKQFAFAGIDVYGMLSDYTGKSKKELQDMEITWDMLNGAIIKASSEGGRYFGAMEAQSQTISGKISTLKDSFSAFTGNLTSSLIPTVNKVIDFASQLLDKFNNLDSGTQQATLKIIGFAGALGPALIGFGQINKVLGTVTGKFSGFGSKLKGIPSIVGKAGSSFGNFGKQVTSGLSTIFSGGIFDKIGGTFSKGFGKISSVLSGFGSKMLVPFQVLGGKIGTLLSPVTTALNSFGGKINGVFSNITGAIGRAFPNVTAGLSKIGGAFGGAFSGIMGNVGNFASKFLPIFTKAFGISAIIGAVVAGLGMLQQNFGTQINSILQNMTEKGPQIIGNLVNGITSKIPELISLGGTLLNNFLQTIIANLPAIISGGIQIIGSLVTGIAQQLPTLIPTVLQVIMTIFNSLIANLPTIIQAGLQLLVSFIQGIVNAIPQLIAMLPTIITTICTVITEQLPNIIQAGITILVTLIQGLVDAIPQLVAMLPQIINTIITTLIENLPLIIDAGIQILIALIDGLIQAIPMLIEMLPQIISTIVTVLAQNLPKIVQAGGKIITSLVAGIGALLCKLGEAAGKIIQSIWNVLKELPGKALQWGKDMIQGFIDGIKNMLGNIAEAAKNVGNKIKEFLHFSRPDKGPLREYETWMPDMVKGLSKTLTKASPKLYNASKDLSEKLADGLDISSIYNKLQSAISLETGDISTKIKSKALLDESKNQPKTIQNDNGVNINNTQNFYNTTPSPYEEQKEAKQQLRRLAYGL